MPLNGADALSQCPHFGHQDERAHGSGVTESSENFSLAETRAPELIQEGISLLGAGDSGKPVGGILLLRR
jgi:hypothetical protein